MTALMQNVLREAIEPALALLPPYMDTPEARVMLLAIGGQESRYETTDQWEKGRKQLVLGPALGWWQFESAGGVAGVMRHPASRFHAKKLCAARGVIWNRPDIWRALKTDQVLAAGFARLLLFTDRRPLPDIGQGGEAWDYYLRNWKPGKPHPSTWAGWYAQAEATAVAA